MITPKGYCQIYQLENYLLRDILTDFEPQVSEWIAQMETYIESFTRRVFIADSVASIRKFEVVPKKTNDIGDYTESVNELQIDDCVAITKVEIDDEEVLAANYLTYPANELPITRIKLTDASGLTFTEGEQNIEVTAKWGYSVAVPNDISFACMMLVVGIINYSGNIDGKVKSETIGSYSVTFKDNKEWQDFDRAKEILNSYSKVMI